MSYQNILCEQNDSVLKITLNRPEKLNALTDVMLQELRDAFAKAAGDRATRAVLLTGAGKGFCPGQDLANIQELSHGGQPDYGDHVRNNYNPLILAMVRLPKPIVCRGQRRGGRRGDEPGDGLRRADRLGKGLVLASIH